jgi:hypothetical protein
MTITTGGMSSRQIIARAAGAGDMLRGAAAARGRASEVEETILKLCGEAPDVRPVCLKSMSSYTDRLVDMPLRDGRMQQQTVHQLDPSAP